MPPIKVMTNYYQHFDGDHDLAVPEDGFGGWQRAELDLAPEHTAVVVMHAWDCGRREEYPGWWRAVPYIPRSYEICRTVFPRLLAAVRASDLKLFHVIGGGYAGELPGYRRAVELAGEEPAASERIATDDTLAALRDFKAKNVHPGEQNQADIARGGPLKDFPVEARPQDDEGVAATAAQLLALCKESGVNHLIYCGFAINWCLLLSPGGMADMTRHGIMCSAIRQATTAVENKESAADEWAKEIGLWRVALAFGFVYDVDDLVGAISPA